MSDQQAHIMHTKANSALALKFILGLVVALVAAILCLIYPPLPGFNYGKLMILVFLIPILILFFLIIFIILKKRESESEISGDKE